MMHTLVGVRVEARHVQVQVQVQVQVLGEGRRRSPVTA